MCWAEEPPPIDLPWYADTVCDCCGEPCVEDDRRCEDGCTLCPRCSEEQRPVRLDRNRRVET